jgi:hypothetical protein
MKKKKVNIDLDYSNSDTNVEYNSDKLDNQLNLIPDVEFDDVYDDLDFMDQYNDDLENDDDEYVSQ